MKRGGERGQCRPDFDLIDVLNQDPAYPNFRHALLLVAVVLALQVAFAIPLAVLGVVLKSRVVGSPWSLGVMNLLAIGAVLGWGCWRTGAPWPELFPLRAVPLAVWPAVLASQSGMLIVGSELDNFVRFLLPPPSFFVDMFAGLTADASAGSFFALVLVAPLTEELLFRGLILRGLLRRGSVTAAIVLSALLFGLVHLNPWQSTTTTMMGLLLGWWTVRTGSLLPALAAHALNNSGVLWHRHLPFEVTGFNNADVMSATAQFQPLWFDAIGVVLLAAGIVWLHRAMPPRSLGLAGPGAPAPNAPDLGFEPARPGEVPPVIDRASGLAREGPVHSTLNSFDRTGIDGSHGGKSS